MMSGRLRLETFAEGAVPAPDTRAEAEREEIRGTAFEQGYSAGWDDAISARETEEARLRQAVLSSLSDLSFSYHEAHAHVLSAIRPLLLDMVRKVLPSIARDTLGPMIVDLIMPVAQDLAAEPVSITVSPSARGEVEAVLAGNLTMPVTVTEDAELSPGQAFLRLGRTETRVDLDGVVAAISAAVETFFAPDETEEKLRA
jgi:flagellar assembly protein FliH